MSDEEILARYAAEIEADERELALSTPAPTIEQVQQFARETEREFIDALYYLTNTPLSQAAALWLTRNPAL